MRKTVWLLSIILILGIAISCSFTTLEDFENPADSGSEAYQGYLAIDDPNQLVTYTQEGIYLPEPKLVVSEVIGAQSYHLQIASDEAFTDIAYENYFTSNVLEPDLPKNHQMRYWKVRAKFNDIWGTWSSSKSFTYLSSQTLYFDSQGGSAPAPAYKSVTEGSQYGVLPTVNSPNKVFDGWWGVAGGNGDQITAEATVPTSNGHVAYAKWLPQYTVSFDCQGGNTPSPTSKVVTYGQQYEMLPTVIRTGYIFDGWWTGANETGEQVLATSVVSITSDQILYAKWNANSYTVSFDSQGGSNLTPVSKVVTYDQQYGILATTEKAGFSFDGWWTGVNGTGTQVLSTTVVPITSDQTLYAKWSILIGSLGPAGGYIFYDKGLCSDGWRYLEAAPESAEWSDKVWGGSGISVGGTGTAIGTGKSNTQRIVSSFGNAEPYERKVDYAAKLCTDLVVSKDGVAYDDWFLPSRDELDQMYQNLKKNNIGGFSGIFYWSSSEYGDYLAWYQYFVYGSQDYSNRYFEYRVRSVRAF